MTPSINGGRPVQHISVTVDADVYTRLAALARYNDCSVPALVRLAIHRLLRLDAPRPPTAVTPDPRPTPSPTPDRGSPGVPRGSRPVPRRPRIE